MQTENTIEPILKMSKDIKQAAATLSDKEARFLVDAYYTIQEDRKRSNNQVRALSTDGEPHDVLLWFASQNETLENQIKGALDRFSMARTAGKWARDQVGIGPVIAAGLLAHIDITRAPTVGHIWRFAGLDPTQQWLGAEKAAALMKRLRADRGDDIELLLVKASESTGIREQTLRMWASEDKTTGKPKPMTIASLTAAMARRPWNANFKTLCWKIGESFVKVSGNPDARYGQYYVQRKEQEEQKNEAGGFAETAAKILETKNIGKTTEAYKAYIEGRLPKGHLHSRAKRYAVKMFLSHYHHIAYEAHFGVAPPKPFAIDILGHAHYDKP